MTIPALPPYPARWQISAVTVAGGNDEGHETNQLNLPYGLFVDENETVYVADYKNDRIMAWKLGASAGEIVAGTNGEGTRSNQLDRPTDVIGDRQTDSLLICDRGNERVMRWSRSSPSHRRPETAIDNVGCWGLAMDDQGSIYVSDHKSHEVRRYDKGGNKAGTVVAGGNGRGSRLDQLNVPTFIFVDGQFTVYVSDWGNNRVMAWKKGAKNSTVVAGGNGYGENMTQLARPTGVWVDGHGHVYVADSWNHRVVRWEKGAKQGTVIVEENKEVGDASRVSFPQGLFFDRNGHLYVCDFWNHRVQRFSPIVE